VRVTSGRPAADSTAPPCNWATAPARSPACLPTGLGLLEARSSSWLRERAYEVLLGFGFGGTLLALFMRRRGRHLYQAADVGADLVGKVERGSPRTTRATPPPSPQRRQRRRLRRHGRRHLRKLRGAIVAAMILATPASPTRIIFPFWSGHRRARLDLEHVSVKAGPDSTSDEALHSVTTVLLGSIFSFVALCPGLRLSPLRQEYTPSTRRRWEGRPDLVPSARKTVRTDPT